MLQRAGSLAVGTKRDAYAAEACLTVKFNRLFHVQPYKSIFGLHKAKRVFVLQKRLKSKVIGLHVLTSLESSSLKSPAARAGKFKIFNL